MGTIRDRLVKWWNARHDPEPADTNENDEVLADALEHHAQAVEERVQLMKQRAQIVLREKPRRVHG